jgi:predicted TIM-barrel fold metal-dependent hydrolase
MPARVAAHLRQVPAPQFPRDDGSRARSSSAARPVYRERDAAEIMQRKNWDATGAYYKEDRSRALDHLGFASQLIFNTYVNGYMSNLESTSDDLDLIYGLADAHNRALLDFCSVDRRLLPTAYVPLADFDRAKQTAEQAIKNDFAALLVPSACPRTHSPSHVGLFPVWRAAEEAGIPVLFHVGGGGKRVRSKLFPERSADTAGLSRRRREFSLGRLHGNPVSGDANPRYINHRRHHGTALAPDKSWME